MIYDHVFEASQAIQNVGPELMKDEQRLSSLAAELPLPRPIRETISLLKNGVNLLRQMGGTALGPGLLLSVKLAGRVPGSRVVLVTDGCANEGLGCVDTIKTGLEGTAFYPFVGGIAKELGVVVNVISFKGISFLLNIIIFAKKIFYCLIRGYSTVYITLQVQTAV